MAGLYVDTSALGRVLLGERDSEPIEATLDRYESWWSSELLIVELRRLAALEGLSEAAEEMLGAVQLVPLARAELEAASRLEPFTVRSLDAVHLQAAVSLNEQDLVDSVLTFDRQLIAGCEHHGLRVESPS